MAAGVLGLWEAIARFDRRTTELRLSTYAIHWIRKDVAEALKEWSADGIAGETRADKYLFSNPGASADEIVAAIDGKLRAAHKAVERASGCVHEQYDTTEFSDRYVPPAVEVRGMYSCFAPQRWNRRVGMATREFEKWQLRRLKEIGRQAYADELAAKDRSRNVPLWERRLYPAEMLARPAPRRLEPLVLPPRHSQSRQPIRLGHGGAGKPTQSTPETNMRQNTPPKTSPNAVANAMLALAAGVAEAMSDAQCRCTAQVLPKRPTGIHATRNCAICFGASSLSFRRPRKRRAASWARRSHERSC